MKKIAILGAGGHSKVLIETIRCMDKGLQLEIYDADPTKVGTKVLDVTVAGTDQDLLSQSKDELLLINGLGTTKASDHRHKIFRDFKEKGFQFLTVVHPSAVVASDATLEEGAQVMAGVIVQPSVKVGANSILNTGCTIDHDSIIGMSCHIAPGVTLSGNVSLGNQTHIGTGANIIQGVNIGASVTVGAGSTVIRNVADGKTVVGSPASEIIK